MMRVARAIWRFLSHPGLSAAGNLSFLLATGLPLAVAALAAVAGRAFNQPLLFLVAIGLALIGLALVAFSAWHQRSPKPKALGRRKGEHLDNILYPPRNDRLELGEQCATFAMKMHVFNEEQEWKRERAIARNSEEVREADPDIDPQQARKDAEAHFERNVEAAYAFQVRDEALRLFDEAREQGAIAARSRPTAERPFAFEMGEVPNLFVAIARRLGHEPVTNQSRALDPPSDDLRDKLDSLMREGIDLVEELSVSVEPVRTDGGWRLDMGGGAPEQWWDKAEDFAQRIRELLIQRHPALLTDYRDGYNAHVKKERKDREGHDPAQDERSTPEKMLDFANFERSGPRRVVEASLEGLAATRHRVGAEPALSFRA